MIYNADAENKKMKEEKQKILEEFENNRKIRELGNNYNFSSNNFVKKYYYFRSASDDGRYIHR